MFIKSLLDVPGLLFYLFSREQDASEVCVSLFSRVGGTLDAKSWKAEPGSAFGAHPLGQSVAVITAAIKEALHDFEKFTAPSIFLICSHVAEHCCIPISDKPLPIILQIWWQGFAPGPYSIKHV